MDDLKVKKEISSFYTQKPKKKKKKILWIFIGFFIINKRNRKNVLNFRKRISL